MIPVTILLSLVINLSLLSQFVPNSSDNFPVVGVFFLVSIVLVGLSVVLNVLTLFIHSCAMDPMPMPHVSTQNGVLEPHINFDGFTLIVRVILLTLTQNCKSTYKFCVLTEWEVYCNRM